MTIDLNKTNISLTEALLNAKTGDTIVLKANHTYFEKINVTIPNLTLIGNNSIVEYNDCHSTLNSEGKKVGTTGSATFKVSKGADNFKAYNITFVNSHKRSEFDSNQAVAFKSEVNNIYLEGCKFISTQDTLYIDNGTNNIIKNAYVEGDIDFIFGSADVLIVDSTIKALNHKFSFFTAPNTYEHNKYGLVFKNCRFDTDSDNTYLGRRWFPSGATNKVFPKVSFIECTFDEKILTDVIIMHKGDPEIGITNIYKSTQGNILINKCNDINIINDLIKK